MTTIIGSSVGDITNLDPDIATAAAETVAGTYEIDLTSHATINLASAL